MVENAESLLRKAERFERIARLIDDARALHALRDLARAYRRRVDHLPHHRADGAAHHLGLSAGRRSAV